MALRRDDADATKYAALKHERYQITQEIARLTARNFDRDIGRLKRRVASIETEMRDLQMRSPIKLV